LIVRAANNQLSYPVDVNESWEKETLERCPDPERAARALAALKSSSPNCAAFLRNAADLGTKLFQFLVFSPVSLDKVLRKPELLDWLISPDVLGVRERIRATQSFETPDGQCTALRSWKSQEMLRIAFREFATLADIVESTRDITLVAEGCVTHVYQTCFDRLAARWGSPETGFGILAMGKFGGFELNYSSDIDLIFFYGQDGWLNPRFSYHEFFTRLAEKIIEIFSERRNPLFRIDLRLRPEGSTGPLVRSFPSMENYYAGYGETWERMALIKARGIAGDEELDYEFNHRLQPFIFPRAVSSDLVEEVADLKLRIEREMVSLEDLHLNIKLGYGGIREIEFTVQVLQLLHGARHAFLQEKNTLKALRALKQLELLPAPAVKTLEDAYLFLRKVEHRLQMINEQQTHTLPASEKARWAFAHSLDFSDLAAFDEILHRHTAGVRAVFENLLAQRDVRTAPERKIGFFADKDRAEKTLAALCEGPSNIHIAPRTRRLYTKLEPELLRRLSQAADPDAALNRFVRFVDAYGIRGLLFETLLANPRLLELLIRLFDASAIFTDAVIRRPQLIEELTRGRSLGVRLRKADFVSGLAKRSEALNLSDWLRIFRRAEIIRILLRDVLEFAPAEDLQAETTDLAEACLEYAVSALGVSDLTVIGLGKLGGRELMYGADLDLVFIGQEPAQAERLIALMSLKTAEGRVFPIDARLRPEGDSGPLVVSAETHRQYFEKRAQLWEIQALTKARALLGPETENMEQQINELWSRHPHDPELCQQIYRMYQRIVHQRSKGAPELNFKTGAGGLMAIEFVTQYLQMRQGVRETGTLAALAKLASALPERDRETLAGAYRFFRQTESALRRVGNLSVSLLPAAESDQQVLARRLGFASATEFLERYQTFRNEVAILAEGYLGRTGDSKK
jgi:[glutamine synthetase] adenylyltransferase / [glutamine synthetase]-adenylyl-L-tyrosine phosphorylase